MRKRPFLSENMKDERRDYVAKLNLLKHSLQPNMLWFFSDEKNVCQDQIMNSHNNFFAFSVPPPRCHHHHHHQVVLLVRISLTLSRYFSLSFIASGRSSGLHPVSSHSCCMYVLAGCPAFARPYVGVHRSTSLMSSSLLLQQCTDSKNQTPSPHHGVWSDH